ncbi:MAG TPA: hypothetical protein VIL46_09135, partial [Gemmataceae bacterium]
ARYLDADPAREPLWQARLSATRELLPSLDLSPPGSVDEGWLTARTEELSRKARDLEAAVAAYAPFSLAPGAGPADPANWVLRSVLRPDAGPAALARIDALLEFPSMPVDQRLRLLAARAAAARRSGEATRDQDLADSGAPLPEPVFSEADQAAFRDAEVRRAAVRARCHVALLRLAGLPETTLGDLEQALRRAVRDGRDSPAWPELAEGIRLAWARDLGEVLRLEEASPERADLLGFLYPAYTPVPALDSPPGGPRAAREGRLRGELYRWLADRYRYAAASGLDPEFFEDAAQDMERLAPPAPPVRVTITPPAAAPVSDAAPRDVVLPVRVTGPRAIPDRLEFQVLSHSPRLLIRPEAGVVPLEEDPLTGERAGRIELSVGRDARAPATAASPKGFVVAVRVGDRSYFQEVPLEPPAPEAPLELIVDRVAQNPVGLGDQLRLRPSAAGEQLYVFVRNRSAEPREAVVHLRVPGGGPPLTSAKLTLTPGQTHLVPFDPPPPAPAPKTQTPAPKARTPAPAGTELFLPAELRLEVVDAKPPGEVIASRALRLDVAD